MSRVVPTLEAPLPAPRSVVDDRKVQRGKIGSKFDGPASTNDLEVLTTRVAEITKTGGQSEQQLFNFYKTLQKIYEQLARVVNGRISFGDGVSRDNISGEWASAVTPVTPDTEFAITHGLGYIPQGWLLLTQDKAATLYDSGTPWTTTQIFLKCDISTVAVKVFII